VNGQEEWKSFLTRRLYNDQEGLARWFSYLFAGHQNLFLSSPRLFLDYIDLALAMSSNNASSANASNSGARAVRAMFENNTPKNEIKVQLHYLRTWAYDMQSSICPSFTEHDTDTFLLLARIHVATSAKDKFDTG
jgi:hypothetical protein